MYRKFNVWGRTFDLKIIFDVYEGEDVLDMKKSALDKFCESEGKLLESYQELEKYCIGKDGELIGKSIDNIFKYVIPETLFVKRNTKNRVVALLCRYRFDEEHGIALIYENEELKKVGPQDDIL